MSLGSGKAGPELSPEQEQGHVPIPTPQLLRDTDTHTHTPAAQERGKKELFPQLLLKTLLL